MINSSTERLNQSRPTLVQLRYEGARALAVGVKLYVIGQNGELLDSAIVWFGQAQLNLAPDDLSGALMFVGLANDLTDDGLKNFSLFGAFGFHELSGSYDRDNSALKLEPVPESVWRRWLFDPASISRDDGLACCGMVLRGMSVGDVLESSGLV